MKKRKLSKGRSRTELISDFPITAASAVAPSPPATGGGGGTTPAAPAPEADTTPCPACTSMNDPSAKFCDQCGAAMSTATVGEEPLVALPPDTAPVPPTGGHDGTGICQNGDCGHAATLHADTDAGKNTGECSAVDCHCPGFQASTSSSGDDEDVAVAAAGAPEIPAPDTSAAPAVEGDSSLNAPPPTEGSDAMGPQFTIPVVIIEGQPTGDGRSIAPNALSWRIPPLPLMGLATETHDPEGFDMNDPAVICGRIDGFERMAGEGSTQLIVAHGYYLPNEDGMYFAELNAAMGRLGVSADVAVQASEVTVTEVDPMDGWPIGMDEVLTEGTIMGVTVCPYPAFEGAYIVIGDGTDAPEAQEIPQSTEDAPAVPATPPAAVTAGGQLIHFVTYEECVPCDQGLEVIVASGAGPSRPPAAWFADPGFHPEDGRMYEILDRRGDRVVGGKFACPITVEESGRIYGHIAPWGVCHTGSSGQCVLAPRSKVDYAHFKRGQHIVTAEGEKIRVGVITADTGHAPTSGISATAAMAHYDNTAFACADVNAGEDEFGIWVAGAIRPDATEEQIRALTAASISGDWRNMGGQLELVAALAVNQPGFPLAVVAAGRIESLVAAGSGPMWSLKHRAKPEEEKGDAALRAALKPFLLTARDNARDRINALTS